MHSDQAFANSNHRKGNNKNTSPKASMAVQPSSSSSSDDHKKKKRCNYCKKTSHDISECKKRIASKKKKKEAELTVSFANFAKDQAWGF